LRTRRPLDFKGLTVAGNIRGIYSDLAKELTPAVSGLIADRWDTGAGEIGALVSVSYQERKFRSDLISTGTRPAAPRSCRGRRWWPPTAPMT
jgi:hypothetical protein